LSKPRNTSLNWFIPALVNSSVGSSPGTTGLEATMVWPLDSKNFRKVERISAAFIGWDDPLLLDQQLTDDERAVRDAAHAYCQDRWRRACRRPSATRRPTRPSSARWASWACWARPSPSSLRRRRA
jgi:hypothetical protein